MWIVPWNQSLCKKEVCWSRAQCTGPIDKQHPRRKHCSQFKKEKENANAETLPRNAIQMLPNLHTLVLCIITFFFFFWGKCIITYIKKKSLLYFKIFCFLGYRKYIEFKIIQEIEFSFPSYLLDRKKLYYLCQLVRHLFKQQERLNNRKSIIF